MQYKIIVDKQPSSNPSSEKKKYIIDIEELRVKGDVYDSLNIEMNRTYVTRRLSLSEYGVLSVLEEPVIEELTEVNIELFEGDNYIYLSDIQGNKFYAEYLIKNDFNDIYATKNEMDSAITQTAQSIELSVNQKLEGYATTQEMNSAIQQTAQSITSSVNQTLTNYATNDELEDEVTELNSTITQTASSINSRVSQKVGKNEVISSINQSAEAVQINANKINLDGKQINLTSDNISISSNNFNVDKNGNMICSNGTFNGGKISLTGGTLDNARFYVIDSSDKNIYSAIAPDSIHSGSGSVYFTYNSGSLIIRNSLGHFQIYNGSSRIDTSFDDFYVIGDMHANSYNYDSLQSIKKNITKFNKNAVNIVKEAELYEFNYRKENDTDKKHIGFVIGDEDEKYKTPVELISKSKDGIDAYSMVSVLWKAVQELSARVEQLEKEVHK